MNAWSISMETTKTKTPLLGEAYFCLQKDDG